jgi:prevent-host-death family protein
MLQVAVNQAKNQLSALIHAVEQGEEVVLTRHGKRIARIVTDSEEIPEQPLIAQKRLEAAALLQEMRARVRVGQTMDWQAARDTGRRF